MRPSDSVAGVRVPPLEGGRNFRDLGGYPAHGGRHVRWGRLYRSGSMAELTAADCETLAGLGIRLVCDLRTTGEREAMPSRWPGDTGTVCWSRDYGTSFGDLRTLLQAGVPRADQVRERMHAAYRRLPFEQAPAYRELFARLAAGELPVVFHCTAGKDRTGIAAALILDALGVPRERIVEDYVLTDALLAGHHATIGRQRLLGALSPDVLQAILGSDPEYLHAAFAAIEREHGDTGHYLREALGIDTDALTAIRAHLLD
ncbi:MAG TPA: tyrosine-protein phosphatase [Solimonas sp.]|nr:tyrosine-protein phosphatase [Solimonas sp.]